MSEMEITGILLEIKEDIGNIKGTLEALSANLERHVDDDVAVEERVAHLELTRAKGQGRASVWHLVGGGLGAMLGVLGDWLWDRFSR